MNKHFTFTKQCEFFSGFQTHGYTQTYKEPNSFSSTTSATDEFNNLLLESYFPSKGKGRAFRFGLKMYNKRNKQERLIKQSLCLVLRIGLYIPSAVIHACNPSYLRGRDLGDQSTRLTRAKS
jgi:hypothetical protein